MNSLSNLISTSLTGALGWALVHSLWQGVLVTILAAVLMRRQAAVRRYGVAVGALAAQVLLFGLTAWTCYVPAVLTQAVLLPAPEHTVATPSVPVLIEPSLSFRLFLETHFSEIVLLWAFGAGLLALRLVGGWVLVQNWASRRTHPVPATWQAHLNRLAGQLAIRRPVRLLESARVAVPMTIGWLKPIVLLPVGLLTGLSPRQIEAILAHELAHIRRHDYFVNILQSVVEVLFFYHPATWWLSGRVRAEREHCCDDVAIELTGNPVELARALAAIEARRPVAQPQLAMAFGGRKTPLLDRVKRVLGVTEERSQLGINGWAVGFCLLLAGGLAVGQSETEPPAPPAVAVPSAPVVRLRPDLAPVVPVVPTLRPLVELAPPPAPVAVSRVPSSLTDSIRTKAEFKKLDSLTRLMNTYLAQRRPELERLQKQLTEASASISKLNLAGVEQKALQLAQLSMQQQKMSEEQEKLAQKLGKKGQEQIRLKEKQQAKIQAQMDALELQIEEATDASNPAWERTEALSDSLTRLYQPITEISERISEVSERISSMFEMNLPPSDLNKFLAVPPPLPAKAPRPPRPTPAPNPPFKSFRSFEPSPAAAPTPAVAPRPVNVVRPAVAPAVRNAVRKQPATPKAVQPARQAP